LGYVYTVGALAYSREEGVIHYTKISQTAYLTQVKEQYLLK